MEISQKYHITLVHSVISNSHGRVARGAILRGCFLGHLQATDQGEPTSSDEQPQRKSENPKLKNPETVAAQLVPARGGIAQLGERLNGIQGQRFDPAYLHQDRLQSQGFVV